MKRSRSERSLTSLLSEVTLYDVLKVIVVKNLRAAEGWSDKRTWVGFHFLVIFFKELRENPRASDPKWLSQLLDHAQYDNVDHALVTLMHFSGLVYWIGTDDNHLYMEDAKIEEAIKFYNALSGRKKAALDRIARLYGKKLKQIGR